MTLISDSNLDTLTEKVDQSKNGWEMWVADENLMKDLSGQERKSIQPHQTSNSISSSNKGSSSPQSKPKSKSPNHPIDQHSSSQPQSKPHDIITPDTRSNQINNLTSSPNQNPTSVELSIQEPNSLPSPNQLTSTSTQSFSPTNTTQLPLDSIRSPITISEQALEQKMNSSRYSTPNPQPQPSFDNQPTTEPITRSPQPHFDSNGPYTHAFELNDSKVTRVAPLTLSGWSIPNTQVNRPAPVPISVPQALPVAEVCVECMMRDRDMADVDVLGPGVWDRKSDADFQEAMAVEAQLDEQDELESLKSRSGGGITNTSREGSSLCNDSLSSGLHRTTRKKRLGFGSPLTQPALKAWTQMNPPAASHRWRTLQLYLKEQAHYLELEHKAKLTTQVENERVEQAIRHSLQNVDQLRSSQGSMGEKTLPMLNGVNNLHKNRDPSRQSTILSNGLMLETVDISKDEQLAALKGRVSESKNRHSVSSRRFSSASATRNGFSTSPVTPLHASPSFGGYNTSTDMLSHVPMSAPHFLTSSGSPSPRAPSPSRFSVRSGFGESIGRPFSRWSRNRRSTSQSILSYAPSGSMIDMHVGLSHDRHNMSQHELGSPQLVHNYQYPNTAPVILTPAPSSTPNRQKSRSKKALNGILMKLGLKRHKSTDGVRVNNLQSNTPIEVDNEPLAPPPSLSLLAREQQSAHRRNPSCLSLPNQRPIRSTNSNGLASPIQQNGGSRSPNNNPYFSTIIDDDDEELIDGPIPSSQLPTRRDSKLRNHQGFSRDSSNGLPSESVSRSNEPEEIEPDPKDLQHSGVKLNHKTKHHSLQRLMSKSMSMISSSNSHRRQSASSNLLPTSTNLILNQDQMSSRSISLLNETCLNEKSRRSVSRSNDFLALRYLSVNDTHQHQHQ
ncbi:hypothetical protein DFH28DRAFT_981047, partial [Melampsora americana]